jgi:hypothetical protein
MCSLGDSTSQLTEQDKKSAEKPQANRRGHPSVHAFAAIDL